MIKKLKKTLRYWKWMQVNDDIIDKINELTDKVNKLEAQSRRFAKDKLK